MSDEDAEVPEVHDEPEDTKMTGPADDGEDAGEEGGSSNEDEYTEPTAEAGRGKRKLEVFAAAMANILNPSHKKMPALSKTVAKQLKEMANDRTHGRKEEDKKAAKRRLLDKDLVVPSHVTATFEKTLRKTATRGVVALFNAIKSHQKSADTTRNSSSKTKANEKRLSKEKFLQMLQNGNKSSSSATDRPKASKRTKKETRDSEPMEPDEEEEGNGGKAGWDVLQDDMLTGATMRDWNKIDTNAEKGKKKTRNTFAAAAEEATLWADDDDEDDDDDGGSLDGEQ